MAKGIVVKVWNVKAGNGTRSAASQISDSIDYIENPEKTGIPLNITSESQLGNELTYVTNEVKTAAGLYVGCRHISDISHATDEMMQVKQFYGKLDGRVATHGIVSLDASESDPRNAGKLMELLNELMEKVFPDNQVVYAVHTNTENLHIHFIINTVGLDGKKIHMDKMFMRQVMEVEVNNLAEKYGFTPNEAWRKEKTKDPLTFPQRKIMLRNLVDIAIEQTDEFDAFVAYLRNEGLTVNVGRNITLQLDEMPFALRSGQLGDNYSISAIKKRLDSKYDPFKPVVAGDYYASVMPEEMVNIVPKKMKAYEDMTKEEKVKVVHLLRLGRNPWSEARWDNWQMQKMADELKNVGYVYKLVRNYSGGTDQSSTALKKITEYRQQISEERKAVRGLMKEYKPIIGIYQEMKQYMVRACLYDVYGYSEFKDDFEKYKELCHRLEVGYGKSVDEVAELVFELNTKYEYLKAQDKELNAQYKAIKGFIDNGKLKTVSDNFSFFHAVGHSNAVYEARQFGIYASDMKYIIPEKGDVSIRVVTRPAMKDGKPTVETVLTVIDKAGHVGEDISSLSMSEKEFNKRIHEIQTEYHIKKCEISRKNIIENVRRV
ncbi:Relaxase/Mobilisation nuclease domain-containing protein [Lachnospiraceae bacterium C10]|nr:Relaxase/Mobilisation nuclease domain-containing protein [Lachnospiraceae bacterium C10]